MGDQNIQKIILTIYFLFATFFFMIHLFNMLIAIMGEAFSANNEIKYMQQTKNHL